MCVKDQATYSQPTKHAKNYGIIIFDYEGHNLWHTW